jgi:ElaB/YqjD/DUF883 family membrane-anchored ribosome-binding protein
MTLEEIEEIKAIVKKVYEDNDEAWKAGIELDGNYLEYIKSLIAEVQRLREAIESVLNQKYSISYAIEKELREALEEEINEWKTCLSAEILSLEQRDRIKAEARVKELEEERKGMVRLTEADMKKLGWSYT